MLFAPRSFATVARATYSQRVRSLSALVIALAATGLATAASIEPRVRYEAGDLAELRRWAADAPLDAIERGLASDDRVEVLTAITAAPASRDAIALLPALARLAGHWDRSIAAPAARAAYAIAHATDGDRAIADDLDDDALEAAAAAWTALAGRRDRWSDVRTLAVEIALDLTAARAATADTAPDRFVALAAYVGDPDPEVRLAALERLDIPAPPSAHAPLVDRVIHDPDPRVRLVAAQALCAADAAVAVAALGADGLAALRAAVVAEVDRPGALLDAARCLADDDDPRSVRALVQLRHQAPRVLRGPLGALARRRGPP